MSFKPWSLTQPWWLGNGRTPGERSGAEPEPARSGSPTIPPFSPALPGLVHLGFHSKSSLFDSASFAHTSQSKITRRFRKNRLLFRPEIGNRSQSSDLSEAELALCPGYSRTHTSFYPFPSNVSLARALTATFGMQVIWMFASADQGLRSLRRTIGRRGAGYALTFTVVVILAGAAGMLHFEKDSPDPQGIHSYPKALWWVAMQITNIGSGYRPVTLGGHVLCLGISIFAVAIFGYLTALFAAFFIGRDAEDPKSEIPNQTSIHQLSGEVALLRKAIEDVLKRVPDAAPRLAEPP